jgi:hypothetical protein
VVSGRGCRADMSVLGIMVELLIDRIQVSVFALQLGSCFESFQGREERKGLCGRRLEDTRQMYE